MKEFLTTLLEEYVVTVGGETYIPVPKIPLIVGDITKFIEGAVWAASRDATLEAYGKRDWFVAGEK